MAFVYAVIFGIAIFILAYHYMQKVFDWLRFQSIGTRDYIYDKLGLMFIETTPNKVLFWLIVSSVAPFVLIFLAFLPNIVAGLIFGSIGAILGWKLPKPIINMMFNKRIEKFNMQMVDALNLMSNAMKSGLSVIQALSIVVEQMPNPIGQEFNLVLSENKVGVSVEDAFANLARRVPCEDVDMFVTSITILKETGGNLAETFETIVYMIRERLKVENKIKALTAQGYYQGMMLLSIPPILGLYFYVSEPGFMDPMFNKPLGWIIMSVVIGLEVVAYFVITKVVQVDV